MLNEKESQNIEWKQRWQDEHLKSICGFANAQGGRIYIGKFDDRLSLWNAGGLPVELTIEKLFQVHESIPRNPLITEVCYRAGYIDSWGRGVQKITDACEQAGLSSPAIIERTGGIAVELIKSLNRKDSEGLGNRLGNRSGNRLGNTKESILAEMKKNPKISAAQLAGMLKISITATEKHIRQLREGKQIKRIGGTRGHWQVIE